MKAMSQAKNCEVKVTFVPRGRTVKAHSGANLLDLAHEAAVDLHSSCNGSGTCGKCKMQVLEGEISPITGDESHLLTPSEIAGGFRLACRTEVRGDVKARVVCEANSANVRILEDGFRPKLSVRRPVITKSYVELSKPTLADSLSDLERIERGTHKKFAPRTQLTALRNLPAALRESGFKVTAVLSGREVIGVEGGDTTADRYGVAVDIGTTTVVVSLIDMSTGLEAATASAVNPQGRHGQDVLSRIGYAEHADGLKKLNRLIVQGVNQLISAVCEESGVRRERVYEIVVAGNATMIHLLLGIPPTPIGVSPYVTVLRDGATVNAADLGLQISDFGQAHVLPSVSGYVGADIVAGVLTTGLHESEAPALLVDIGTNGEIVFGSRDGLVACSCAAGPALEGMNIRCGTVAVEGAIETVSINGSVEFKTIGGATPVGICGSGIIDAVAELLKASVVQRSGRMVTAPEFAEAAGDPSVAARIDKNGEARFLLTENHSSGDTNPIFISQKDIRQVQLAKGAVSSGIRVLLEEVGVQASDVARVYVAGAFGQHLRIESLVRIGLIPEELASNVVFVGNSSKTGAALSLLSKEKRAEAQKIARKIKYFELSIYPGYERLFIEALTFPKEGNGSLSEISEVKA